jgi:hypothetical protein
MDGVFYNTQAGSTSVTMSAATPWSSGSANVTGLTGFTQNPIVQATADVSYAQPITTHVEVTSTSTFTLRAFRYTSSSSGVTVKWVAFQATPSSSTGS